MGPFVSPLVVQGTWFGCVGISLGRLARSCEGIDMNLFRVGRTRFANWIYCECRFDNDAGSFVSCFRTCRNSPWRGWTSWMKNTLGISEIGRRRGGCPNRRHTSTLLHILAACGVEKQSVGLTQHVASRLGHALAVYRVTPCVAPCRGVFFPRACRWPCLVSRRSTLSMTVLPARPVGSLGVSSAQRMAWDLVAQWASSSPS